MGSGTAVPLIVCLHYTGVQNNSFDPICPIHKSDFIVDFWRTHRISVHFSNHMCKKDCHIK